MPCFKSIAVYYISVKITIFCRNISRQISLPGSWCPDAYDNPRLWWLCHQTSPNIYRCQTRLAMCSHYDVCDQSKIWESTHSNEQFQRIIFNSQNDNKYMFSKWNLLCLLSHLCCHHSFWSLIHYYLQSNPSYDFKLMHGQWKCQQRYNIILLRYGFISVSSPFIISNVKTDGTKFQNHGLF